MNEGIAIVLAALISTLITGIFTYITKRMEIQETRKKVIENKPELNYDEFHDDDNNRGSERTNKSVTQRKKKKVIEAETKKNTSIENKLSRKKFSDMPLLQRVTIPFFIIFIPIIIFFYHTGMFPKPEETFGATACPNRQNFPDSEKLTEQEVWVKNGYEAYYTGWLFDGQNGGYFITFKGPYKASHTFGNGVYCPPVPMDTDLARSTEELLLKECEASEGGCSKPKTCTQSIFGYHLTKGVCNETED